MRAGFLICGVWLAVGMAVSPAGAQMTDDQKKAVEDARRALKDAARVAREAQRNVFIQRTGGSFLGIGVAEIDAERAKALNLREERGVEVKSVEPESPAAKAGLKEGDVVLEYNGQRVEGTEQFIRLVRETPPGRQAKLLIWRGGATQTIVATLAKRKPGFAFAGPEGFEFHMPEMPPMPPMPPVAPDIPRVYTSMRSSRLGIETESLNTQLAAYFGVKEGVLVRSVTKGSAAEKAGIKAGDVIVKVDGETVTSPREISSILRSARSKKTLAISIYRDRKPMTVTVTIEDAGSDVGWSPAAPLMPIRAEQAEL